MRNSFRSRRAEGALICMLSLAVPAFATAQTVAPGERISINAGWRFQLGDPEGLATPLMYDVRPIVTLSEDGKEADAKPEEAAKVDSARQQVLKPWIMPSGNAFINDPARRYQRPAGDPGSNVSYVQASFDDGTWRDVTLPHDWAIAGPFIANGPYGGMGRLPSWGIGWYRKKLDIPASDRDRSIFLDIDGAMSYATVWLNGKLVGGWPYGYNSFRLDLTPQVTFGGSNQLVVRLDNPPHSARWYPGGGLYRNVWLTKTSRVHVSQWGTQVTTPQVSRSSATIDVAVSIDNDSQTEASVDVSTDFYALDEAGKRSGGVVAKINHGSARIAAGSNARVQGSTTLANPRLWGPRPTQTPNRYVAVTTVSRAGKAIDRYETRFGIRSLRLDPNSGVYVNDERVPLNGVNNHHDLGALGAAFNVRAAERQLEMLQEMGANAVRMSHNPPAPELLELTDRMGILVMDEVFDVWERKKTPLDFHLIFPDWHEQDLRSMLRRDRNHPSVILWSVGNEVGEQYTCEHGAAIANRLVSIVREEDPTRLATTAMNWAKPEMPLPAAVDVISLNYQGAGIRSLPGQFPAFRERFPNKLILSSESASALSSRGEYQFPVPGTISGPVRPGSGGDPKTCQVSAYELFAADFGSSADRAFAAQDQHPYVAGEFVWTGWDYLGEPTPYYSSRSSYSGIIDLAGFKKDRFYLYRARWRPDVPLAHLLPHWTWPGREGEVTPVHLITSGDEAELFVNGKSQGRKKRAAYEYRLRWDYVTYEPGELRAVSYKNGKEWATASVRTTDAPAKLELTADRSRIQADGLDLSFITVRVLDNNGQPAPTAKNSIRFSLDGPGEIVATDNGDPTSFVPFQSPVREAFNGLALVIVRGKPDRAGKITVRAESTALEAATVTLSSAKQRE
ncbi:beta-galactosidase GalB [Steroidobacter flavus]|uniref:Beta-galactosidase GalB n=1 Tax=Steroidobacter flavus TaxID=1842136 RepID=A0ABV8SSZ5_9GAMM